MNAFLQRIDDWFREQRIYRLSDRVTAALIANDYRAASEIHKQFRAEILNRSPQQVARMERRRGLVR